MKVFQLQAMMQVIRPPPIHHLHLLQAKAHPHPRIKVTTIKDPSDNLSKSNLRESPKSGSPRGPPSPKNHLHVKFQLEKEALTNAGSNDGGSSNVPPKEEKVSKAIRQLNFEEPSEKNQVRRYTVLERLEKKLTSPDRKKEFSDFKQHNAANAKVSARVKQIESQSTTKNSSNESLKDSEPLERNLLDRPSTPSGNSPRIQEGLIKKLEPSKEKTRLGEFKLAAKIHKRKTSDGPTPLKAKGSEASTSLRTDDSSLHGLGKGMSNEHKSLSRENSGEFQLKRSGSRASSSESLNGSGSGSRSTIEKLLDSRSSSSENISEDRVRLNSDARRQRNNSGGSTDRNSIVETLTDGDTGEDPLACGLKRKAKGISSRRPESGSETDDYSPTSTKDNVISIKDRSPSPGSGFVRKGSYRRKRTTSGGSEDNENFRDILPDKRELVPNRRRMSGEIQELDKAKHSSYSPQSTNDSAEKSKSQQQRPWKRRAASDSCLENQSNSSSPVSLKNGASGSSREQSSKIPIKSQPGEASYQTEEHQSPFAMSRVARGRHSERVRVAKKEVPTGKRSSSVGAARDRGKQSSDVVADKPPLAKPSGKSEKVDNKDGAVLQKSSRSASREELIRR